MSSKSSSVKSEARVAKIAQMPRDPVTGRLMKKTPQAAPAPAALAAPAPADPEPAGGGAPAPGPFRGFRARLRQRSGS